MLKWSKEQDMEKQTLERQFKLWTIFLVVVPSLLIMTIYTISQIKVAKQQNLEMISQRVYSQDRLIGYWMEERVQTIRQLSRSKVFKELDKEEMNRNLYAMQQDDKNFDSLSYIDENGYFEMSTLSMGIKYPSALGKPYFEEALLGKEYISDVVIGRNSGQAIINFSCPIYSFTGEIQGVILGSVRTETLEVLLRENWLGQTGEVFLVNREGIMLTEPRHVDVLIQQGRVEKTARMKFKINNNVFSAAPLNRSDTAEWIDYLGHKVLGAYLDVPERGWTLIGKINEAEVLLPIYKQLAMMAGGTVGLILLLLPLATRITNSIKLPIEWLIRQSSQLTLENYEMSKQDENLKNIPMEIWVLCENFINMSNTIKNTVNLLKKNEATLESKILELSRSEIYNRALVESIPDGLLCLSSEGKVLSAKVDKKTIASIFKETEIIDQYLAAVIPSEIALLFSQAIGEALATGKMQKMEYKVNNHGTTRYREVRMVPMIDHTVLAVIRDITEQKKAAEALEKIRDEIVNAQRMASLGIMAGSIAHEINQPLNSIKVSASGMLYLMDNEVLLSKEDLEREFSRIVSESERINYVINKTRNLIREGLTSKVPLLMDEVLSRVLTLIKEQELFKSVKIECNLDPKQAWMAGNQAQIEQVLFYLLTNAGQALKEKEQQDKVITITLKVGEQITLMIADNGPGLKNKMIDEIFEPFYTTKRTEENLGLGLAIVKSITYAHGGEIVAENNSDGGATFKVNFPLLGHVQGREEEMV